MRVVVVNASLSESSSGTALARRVLQVIEAEQPVGSDPVEANWVDLRSLGHALLDYLYTHVPTQAVREAYAQLGQADLIVAVTPTYQAAYSGLFKLFWDLLPEGELRGKPVLLCATGGTGRHGLMIDHTLRPLFAYLGMIALPTALYAATQDWGDPGYEVEVGLEESLERRIKRAARDVWAYARLTEPTQPAVPVEDEPDPASSATSAFPGFVDFETLLHPNS